MKSLNNKGWGLGSFIIFICIFMFSILLVAVLANKNGIGPDSENIMKTDNELIEQYHNYEQLVKEASIRYQEENYPYISDGDSFNVNINRLDIPNEIQKKCSGYAIVEKKEEVYIYSPYIKCGNYSTEGYN